MTMTITIIIIIIIIIITITITITITIIITSSSIIIYRSPCIAQIRVLDHPLPCTGRFVVIQLQRLKQQRVPVNFSRCSWLINNVAAVWIAGYALKCHTCYSEKSWADCEEHQSTRECSAFPEKHDVCARVTLSKRMKGGGQTVTSFSKYCYQGGLCSDRNCRLSHHDRVEATWCEIKCCNSTGCDFDVAAGSGSQSRYDGGRTILVLWIVLISLLRRMCLRDNSLLLFVAWGNGGSENNVFGKCANRALQEAV